MMYYIHAHLEKIIFFVGLFIESLPFVLRFISFSDKSSLVVEEGGLVIIRRVPLDMNGYRNQLVRVPS
jgi:hypothetical protein